MYVCACLSAGCFTPLSRVFLADVCPEENASRQFRCFSSWFPISISQVWNHCAANIPSCQVTDDGVKKKHWRLNLLFVIQQNKTITSLYGLITEINLGVDTENVDRRRGGRALATPGRENRHQSQTSLTSFPMHDSGSNIQMWKSGTAAAALLFKTQAQQRA